MHDNPRLRRLILKRSMALASSLFVLVLLATFAASLGELQMGYYRGRCGEKDVEGIIRSFVKGRFLADRTISAALLRMQYHDCFVKGCDASLLLDGNSTEKAASPNLTLRGFDFIDEVKEALERVCPGLVSCADIIVAATRDAVVMAGGPFYEVQMGRRDSTVSLMSDVDILPSPSTPAGNAISAFEMKGLSATDMVVLLGGHSVGVAHCSFFSSRLYDFQGSGRPDPSLDPVLLSELRRYCPQASTVDNMVFLDQNPWSTYVLDNSYYRQLAGLRGILQIDEEIWLDPKTRNTVADLANSFAFPPMFARVMVKLGALGVLTGQQGVIRKNCRFVDPATADVNNQTLGHRR